MYWLLKSEPDAFSIDDLEEKGTECWDGVRNYQARNMMRDQMQLGDQAFFYHSSCKTPAIVGVMQVVSEAYADHTAFDTSSPYYDPKSTKENPRWHMVDMQFERKLTRPITLEELKTHSKLSDLTLLKRGNRLSIMPISESHWKFILSLE